MRAALAVVLGLVSMGAFPAHGGGADPRCESAKLAAAGRYAQCRLAAQAASVRKGGPPDYGKCEAGLEKAWASSEARSSVCATFEDLGDVRQAVVYETGRLELWLSGADPLAASRLPASGQVTAYPAERNDGVPGEVAVPDDGTLRAGATLSYVDNGDGTITDLVTGLMWEKKSDDGGRGSSSRSWTTSVSFPPWTRSFTRAAWTAAP